MTALRLETMDGEGEATPCLALEMEGVDVTFLDVRRDGGPLVGSKHEAAIASPSLSGRVSSSS